MAPPSNTAAQRAFEMLRRLKFSPEAAQAVIDQGYEDIDDFARLSDKDISSLCAIVRKPGGDKVVEETTAGTTTRKTISDSGQKISHVAEANFKLAIFFLRHRMRTSRPFSQAHVTLPIIQELRDLRKVELDYVEPKPDSYPTVDERNWPETFDNLDEYLYQYLGEGHLPLAYVVRHDPIIKPSSTDPEAGYLTDADEMIARAPHTKVLTPSTTNNNKPHPIFVSNNKRVWDILLSMCKDKAAMVVIKPHQRTKDGRSAYFALHQHYLGTNAVNDLVAATEAQLHSYKYRGEGKRQNFLKYVTYQTQKHNVLKNLERFGYRGLDPRSKVRILVSNIETESLEAIKAQILSDPSLQEDYGRGTGLFQSYIKQKRSSKDVTFNISQTSSGGGRGGRHKPAKRGRGDDSVEDRYYSKEEYRTLSEVQKQKLWKIREGRGPPSKKAKTGEPMVSKKQFDKVVRRIAAMEVSKKDSSSSSEAEEAPKGNRANKALTKQNVKK